MVTCESTAEEVSYEWSHYNYDFVNMIFIVRTCLHSITPVSIADETTEQVKSCNIA